MSKTYPYNYEQRRAMHKQRETIAGLKQELATLKKELAKVIKEFNQYKLEAVKWSWDDIQGTAKQKGKKCSKKKAQEILELMIDKHDAELGITWITIEYYVDEYC